MTGGNPEAAPLLNGDIAQEAINIRPFTIGGFQTGLNLVKLALGSGCLTLPYAFSQSGILGGVCGFFLNTTLVIILIISAAMNFWAVYMLTFCHERTSAEAKRQTTYSYSAIMYDLAGTTGVALIELLLFLTCFGAVIAYLIFVGSTMSAAVSDAVGRKVWISICTPLLAGMVCLNDFSWLSFMSVGAILGVVVSFVTVYAYGMAEHPYDASGAKGIIAAGLPNFFSIAAFAYAYPVCFFPFYDQMRKRGAADFMRVFSITIGVVFVLFALMGIATFPFFYHTEEGVKQVIIDNLPKHTIYATIVRVAISLVIFLSYPLAFLSITQTVCTKARLLLPSAGGLLDYGSRIGLVLVSGGIAAAIPNMADLIAVVGAFAISTLSFILPPFCYSRMCGREISTLERICVWAFFVASIGVMFYTTYAAVKTLVEHL